MVKQADLSDKSAQLAAKVGTENDTISPEGKTTAMLVPVEKTTHREKEATNLPEKQES